MLAYRDRFEGFAVQEGVVFPYAFDHHVVYDGYHGRDAVSRDFQRRIDRISQPQDRNMKCV